MKHQHHTITTTTLIYLCLFLLMDIISNVVFAQSTPAAPATPKISFAIVEDSGTPPRTASCIIAWSTGENIFCVYDNQFRDNDEIGKMFKSDGTLPPITNNDFSKNVDSWLKKNHFDATAVKAILSYFKDLNGDPSSTNIREYLNDTQSPIEKLELTKDGCSHYNTFAPLITYKAFALFVHDFIHHHLQKSEDTLIKSFCGNTAAALVLLDPVIQPLLQNPDVVKLLNNEKAQSFLDSIKDKGNLLALLNPDEKDTKNFAKFLEILGNPEVTKLLTKNEVVKLLGDPNVVTALTDKAFPQKIDEAIKRYSEIQILLSETQKLLTDTQQLINAQNQKTSSPETSSLESSNNSNSGLSNTLTEKWKTLEKKIDELSTKVSSSGMQTVLPVIVVCLLIVAILLVSFWLLKDILVDKVSTILKKEISNLDHTQQIQKVLKSLTTIEGKISAISNTGSSENVSGMDKAISEIQTMVINALQDAVAQYQQQQPQLAAAEPTSLLTVSELVTALANYQTQQQSIAAQQMLGQRMLEQINYFKIALTNYQLEQQYIEIRGFLDSLHQIKGLVEQMSNQVININTVLTNNLPVTLTGLTRSLATTKEELKTALADSQKQQQTSLESLDGKVAEIDKLLKSKELGEKAVLNLVRGFIETSLDFRNKYEAAQSQRQLLEKDRDTLLAVLEKRFGYTPSDRANLSSWATTLTEQPGTWRWSQSPLWQQLVICQGLLQQLQQQEIAKESQEILDLLFDQDQRFFTGWKTLTSQSFDGDLKLWNYLRTLDGGKWLNRLFRANDLLHAYFADKPQFSELSKHLATTAGLLKVALAEVGIHLLEPPKLLENIPTDIPEKSKDYTPLPLLKKLVKSKVVERSKTAPRLVVDIEAYGFATPDNPQPEVRVVVFSQAEWQ